MTKDEIISIRKIQFTSDIFKFSQEYTDSKILEKFSCGDVILKIRDRYYNNKLDIMAISRNNMYYKWQSNKSNKLDTMELLHKIGKDYYVIRQALAACIIFQIQLETTEDIFNKAKSNILDAFKDISEIVEEIIVIHDIKYIQSRLNSSIISNEFVKAIDTRKYWPFENSIKTLLKESLKDLNFSPSIYSKSKLIGGYSHQYYNIHTLITLYLLKEISSIQ